MDLFLKIFVITVAILGILAAIGKAFGSPTTLDSNEKKSSIKNIRIRPYTVTPNNKNILSFYFRVVGIGFEQSTKSACASATKIILKAENNPHDKNAIGVYNQKKQRIGYIPRDQQDFLNAFHSYSNYEIEITNHYYNIEQTPVHYCELDICVLFCGDYEYLKNVIKDKPRKEELKWSLAGVRKDIKDPELSDSEKYNIISEFNKTLLEFNKQAEKVNWMTIPMQETIVLMNKLKMTSQLEYIETHYDFSVHSPTQEKYLTNYIQKHKNSEADKLKKIQ